MNKDRGTAFDFAFSFATFLATFFASFCELSLALFLLTLSVAHHGNAGVRSGGETGNGHVKYVNMLDQFEISYPQSWKRTSFDHSDYLRVWKEEDRNLEPPKTKSYIQIQGLVIQSIENEEDLQRYLVFFSIGFVWNKTSIQGHPGFEACNSEECRIFIMREAGVIVSIKYLIDPDKNIHSQIEEAVQSFKFVAVVPRE